MSRKTPKYLTKAEKLRIIKECDRRVAAKEKFNLVDIAHWATTELKLNFTPHPATISRVRKDRDRIEKGAPTDRKKTAPLTCAALDVALAQWVCDMRRRKLRVSGEMIKAQGEHLMAEANEHLPDGAKLTLKFSNGWLDMFKKRHRFKKLSSQGKSGDVDMRAIEPQLPDVKEKLSQYALKDIFNADEFGLFYQMAPTRTLGRSAIPGQKARMTHLACANADGTEKIPLMSIGEACRPRSFKGKDGDQLGFDYYSNKKAWMTSSLFFAWLSRFDGYIGKTPGRKAALLLGTCPAHGSHGTLPVLQNTEVIFLPPSTTPMIQPMDAGVIAAVKVRYRYRQVARALGFFDAVLCASEDVYKVDPLTSLKWMREIWTELDEATIFNCWRKTEIINHLLNEDDDTRTTTEDLEIERAALEQLVVEVVPSRVRISIDDLLNPTDEDNCIAEVTDQTLVDGIVHELLPEKNQKDEPDSKQTDGLALPLSEQAKTLSSTLTILEAHDVCSGTVRRAIYAALLKVRAEHKDILKQITD